MERAGDIPVYAADIEDMSALSGYHLTGGALCAMKRRALLSPEEILRGAGGDAPARIVLLEGVTNPTNAGAVFRSAAALSFDAILLGETCVDPLYRRAVRVSMGNVFSIPWTFIGGRGWSWPGEGMARLKDMGYTIVAMALRDDAIDIDDPVLKDAERLVLMIGSEGDGLMDETIRGADHVVRIPMREGVDSLNAAASAAVAFWELGKGRQR